MDGCTAINFVKRQNWFCPSWRCLRCMMAFAGAFTTKQQLMHPHCFVYYDKTWMKTILTCFTKMIADQPSLTKFERPMYHMKEKQICYHPLITISWFVFLILLKRFSIESRFSFFFFTHNVYRKASSRGAYGHDPLWSVFAEHRLDSTTTDITMALFML